MSWEHLRKALLPLSLSSHLQIIPSPQQEGWVPPVRVIPPDLRVNGYGLEVWVGRLRWKLPPTQLPLGVRAEGCTQVTPQGWVGGVEGGVG